MKQKIKDHVSIIRKTMLTIIAVLIIEMLLFALSISFTMNNIKKEATYALINSRLSYAINLEEQAGIKQAASLSTKISQSSAIYVSDEFENGYMAEDDFFSYISEEKIEAFINDMKSMQIEKKGAFNTKNELIFYQYEILEDGSIICIASSGEFFNEAIVKNIVLVIILYLIIFIAGGFVLIYIIRKIVKRINKLCSFVESMPSNMYLESYLDDGDDEIEVLSQKVEDMRQTILKDEANKNLMLQNISHDLKTPLAVIKSYAEAIGDGIEGIESTEIIIKQVSKLEKKVKNLIEFNKLEYLLTQNTLEEVSMKPIILEIVNNCKHISNLDFDVLLDDTKFIGKYENYYIVVENIIDNALRYAKSYIAITLDNGVLKIQNDGEPISDIFIKEGFKPYEKGHNGKFGLGMSIVARTLDYFNMNLIVKNEEDGVSFTISKKEE